MFDTMTVTKAAAALCGALLALLLAKWAAESIYHVEADGEPSYVIEVADGGDEAEDEPEVSFAELMASADPAKGERVFKKCSACHKLEKGANGTGPYLYGVVGREVAAADGFGYSDAMASHEGEWTPEQLDAFLAKPSDVVPGTSMSFAGLKKQDDRVNLIAYLNENSDSPYVIEAAAEEEPAEGAEAADGSAAPEDAEATEETEAPGGGDAAAEETEATEEPAADEGSDATEEPAATEESGATEESEATEEPAATEEPEATDEAAATEEEAPAATETAAVSGDIENGAKVYKKCAACHKLEEGKNLVGPHLYGVVGREVASVEGVNYSDALIELGGTWTPERLDAYLTKPRDFAPGTKMTFSGLRKEEDRTDVIAYLDSIDD
ncbi:Cytochrome c2 [Cribrihabitans marinus]|uniref:Cytochrome c2 n=2 Tax=Cribrihabitans marinus TaxID=1227549 RepID=A0A1H6XQ40_9RHOB|nr:hypothetical protein GCM10010973_15330 [Cribrihabitans marinus]SEJ26970.1 Cytochrome c2 [Cribrihabitans marinus]